MIPYVHLHVHSHYSILDGQATIERLVDKAIKDGMKGMALTDHGNMMGIKDFFNYTQKLKGKAQKTLKTCDAKLKALREGTYKTKEGDKSDVGKTTEQLIAECEKEMEKAQRVVDFKAIFGCEMYCARRKKELKEGRQDQSGWHLVVLAKNKKGYHNLIKLVSRSWIDGFYMRPRTDKHDLERFSEGLIVSSACLGGEIPRKILTNDAEGAEEAVLWFKRVFGEDYYLELQRHEVKDPAVRANRGTYPLQIESNQALIELAKKHGIKYICTNDSHFVDEENAESHDRLICLSTNRFLSDSTRMLYTKQEWFKTQAEMNEVFADLPEALQNTIEICDKVETYSIDHGPIMPNFEIPEDFGTEEEYRARFTEEQLFDEFTQDENGNVVMSREEGEEKIKKLGGYDKLYRIKLEADYLAKLAYEGAHWRYGNPLDKETDERIRFELHIMKTMGFPGYFLIVQDYIKVAREQLDVSVGPGRGSAAGSAVAYCLRITDIDPIKYDLLFERFLNPDRISLPDIDVDFDDDGRGKVLQWVTEKYGAEKVAHIITYGTMATKSALKDVARVQQLPLNEANRLCKLIPDKLPEGPDGKSPKMNLNNAIACIPELRDAETSADPLLRDTIRYAKMLEGNVRNTGVHACGIIICRDDISDWVPISTAEDKETGEKLRCTQYEGSVIEETGLIKMDFLGLKTLSIIREAVENIRFSLGIELDIDNVDIEDPATYQLYCDGQTVGTFQFESPGMQKYLRELHPTTFEDLIAMNALYRPGPMAYIPQFIKRKHGIEPITYDLDCMEKYLKDTYGITVYQEQVMLLSRRIADFTRGESDNLRKAMGKKLIDKLNQMYPKFVKGGQANGHDPQVLEKIWEDWKAFASYAFNKSHATCYSWVAYQTAYLKANFPSQYMAAVMSRSLNNITDLTKFLDECKAMNISCLGPDVNESYHKFSVSHLGNIRFGLGGIKGVGENAVQTIIDERNRAGLFVSVYDFFERVNLYVCNRKNLECLALAGAFDSFGTVSRERFFAETETGVTYLETLITYGQRFQIDKEESVNSLFGGEDTVEISKPKPPVSFERWSDLEKLNKERDLIGIYISGHPLDEYSIVVNHLCTLKMPEIADLSSWMDQNITFGGIVTQVEERISKRGAAFGRVRMEDYAGGGEFAIFGDEWAQFKGYFAPGNSLFVTAQVTPRRWGNGDPDLHIGKVDWLSEVKDRKIQSITIKASLNELDNRLVTEMIDLIQSTHGETVLNFQIVDADSSNHVTLSSPQTRINVTKELIRYLNSHQSSLSYTIN
ncbi:DNA polymerase III subunit alpha [Alloprevotella sp. OH1205_COT-284]|uniref:DNA polymerase III subunit alpha n=1 Tax=Alloprevotella sp. OH1205_COT-284 TaxID=2491043 RepID=UPI000F5DA13E|nr:DNA polymerase III subunit alpha [Alloprevotella sp. OH1205_COT-284]RRD75469.1 DNA polymerase III subunit alpha [Alloprevotella sp. OH1205_COT-284]